MDRIRNKIPPPVIALTIGLLMWALHINWPVYNFDTPALFYIGVTFISIGLCLDILSFFNFRKNKTTVNPISPEKASHLVVEGFYRFTRNPMYLGMLSVLTGTALLFSSLSGFLLLPLFIFLMNNLQIKPEEAVLERLFTKEYLEYKKAVRRWM